MDDERFVYNYLKELCEIFEIGYYYPIYFNERNNDKHYRLKERVNKLWINLSDRRKVRIL